MAAEAQRAPVVRERPSFAGAFRRFVAAIEPWYDWGEYHIDRFEGLTETTSSGVGTARYFEIQWLGVHLHVQIGRTPSRRARHDA